MHAKIVAIFNVFYLLLTIYVGNASAFEHPALDFASSRRLNAAVRKSDIVRRSDVLEPVYDANLTYSDDALWSNLWLRSAVPFIVLEDSANLFQEVRCRSGGIHISFYSADIFESARVAWAQLKDGYVIASHAGCTEEGSRTPYKVQSLSYSPSELAIVFAVNEVKWHEAFHRFRVNFGQVAASIEQFDQLHLQPRQLTASSTLVEADATSLIPTGTPTATSVSLDLSNNGGGGDWFPGLTTNGPNLPIELGCTNCETRGTLELSQGEWEILDPDEWILAENFTDLFSVGFVQFSLRDFFAHIELQVSPSLEGEASFTLFSLTIPGVTGFTLPGIGKAGLILEPQLALSWKLSGGIELTYGFEVEIPDLKIVIDFSDPESSNVTGLDGINLSDVPFSANLTDIELAIELTMQPRVSLGLEFLETLTAVSGLFIDLPKTNVVLKQLATEGFDVNCEPLAGGAGSGDQDDLRDLFQNLTHITTRFDVGIGLDIVAEALELEKLGYSSSVSLVSTQLTQLATTQCLVWQPDATGGPAFAQATAAFADAQSAAAAASSSAGGSNQRNGATSLKYPARGSLLQWLACGGMFVLSLYMGL